MPINYSEYPSNWKEIRERILNRAGNCCEHCGAFNYSSVQRNRVNRHGSFVVYTKIILTIAHLDHDKRNHQVKDERLAALCQKCHLKYDLPRHINNRRYGRNYLRDQLNLFKA